MGQSQIFILGRLKMRCAFFWLLSAAVLWVAEITSAEAAVPEPLRRVPNATLRLPANPPAFGYATTNAFGALAFPNPVAILSPSGETNRLFIVEQDGIISVITNLSAPTRTIFLDIISRVVGGAPNDERGLLGMAFHPGYASNRFFYIYYSVNATTTPGGGLHQRLSRFEASPDDPSKAVPTSELPLITQRDRADNHNGGDLHFGPDGYLYVAVGDEGGGDDTFNNSQRIDLNFHAGILRIDVDKKPQNLPPNPHPAISTNYFVPRDNPYVGATNFNGLAVDPARVRTEFYAVGLRNPWRFSFDPLTGLLYCGDVGQNAWEEIDVIVKGGNYGWAFYEGFHRGPRTPRAGLTFNNPILEYGRGMGTNQGVSVTGGLVYRGDRLSQLWGAYLFADYVSGHLWAVYYDSTRTNTTPFRRLATDAGIAGFGADPRNGNVLFADQSDDRIKTLIYNATQSGAPLPPTLADTGAFADLLSLEPHPGIVPYDLNVPFWSDNARKTRWFSLPDTNLLIGFNRAANWTFPTGMIWIKHFELELTNGLPDSRKRLETRFIVRNPNGVYGITYRWGDSTTNATLVPEEGLDEPFIVNDGGTIRTQVWHYPSRTECLKCHTPAGGLAVGFNTPQLNRDFHFGGGPANQIEALYQAGYLNTNPAPVHTLKALAPATDEASSLEYRVRSYLTANCVQCHQPGASAFGFWDARITTPLSSAGILDGPLLNSLGNPHNRVIKPGVLEESMILSRIATLGPGRMPPIDSNLIDTQAVHLVSAWITNDLPAFRSFAAWQNLYFTNSLEAGSNADPDQDGAINWLEYLTSSHPLRSSDVWELTARQESERITLSFPHLANRGFELEVSSNLSDPNGWRPLDSPENRPLFSSTNFQATISLPLTNAAAQFYRVRIYEP